MHLPEVLADVVLGGEADHEVALGALEALVDVVGKNLPTRDVGGNVHNDLGRHL